MTEPRRIGELRLALGRQLAAYRKAANYSQHQLAPLVGYGRSTVANVEVGRQQVPRAFWLRCDDVADQTLGVQIGKSLAGHAVLLLSGSAK